MPNVAPEPTMQIAMGFMATKFLFVASEIGLFEALATGPKTLEELAKRITASSRTVEIVAAAMVSLGLIEQEGIHYRNSVVAAAFLAGKPGHDLRPMLRYFDGLSYADTIHAGASRRVRQKETEIGLVPESWAVDRLDQYAHVISTRMAYSELEIIAPAPEENSVRVLGIKVSNMNLPGNEVELQSAAVEKTMLRANAERRAAPPRTIIFPKRGAAIATNKKRLSTTWTVFDPNVIGVVGRDGLDQEYLFQWFQTFDLRTITEPGPTPQLNKKNLRTAVSPRAANFG